MKKILRIPVAIAVLISAFCSCNKVCDGCPEPQGGELPTKYIIINDTSFSPVNITASNGNSFTFVNNTGTTKGVISADSMIIVRPTIPDRSSFRFKKDTIGTIFYHMAGKPNIIGSITQTP